MKGFKLTADGDIDFSENDIAMVDGIELTKQTVQSVLGTNKGEWFLNPDEGINFNNLLGKNIEDVLVENEMLNGLKQVDETLKINSFSVTKDTNKRTMSIEFTASKDNDEVIQIAKKYI